MMDDIEVNQHVLRALFELEIILDDEAVDRETKLKAKASFESLRHQFPIASEKLKLDKWI